MSRLVVELTRDVAGVGRRGDLVIGDRSAPITPEPIVIVEHPDGVRVTRQRPTPPNAVAVIHIAHR